MDLELNFDALRETEYSYLVDIVFKLVTLSVLNLPFYACNACKYTPELHCSLRYLILLHR